MVAPGIPSPVTRSTNFPETENVVPALAGAGGENAQSRLS
jgi:hypothetical protein